MTGIFIVGLLYRPQVRLFKAIGWASVGLSAVYLFNSYVIYVYQGSRIVDEISATAENAAPVWRPATGSHPHAMPRRDLRGGAAFVA
ncbi:hypothetical protein K9U39_17260 [Rhodoblastus acidophilus]|uniref:hypothetical protein n=1 Tax=Candidatus Rhodoblastus alkanivorans TaxID=2954117 RepID=UPI001FAA5715|nr:hypothetical protein [Candidatus Rhodoblastus alkanivorans]MCI4678037.1 hypothetical protein [Candidatus Rhodoblastus alkanivorans]MDI4642670.1 hypothetical protein [Rhodoblastus acidophilus]